MGKKSTANHTRRHRPKVAPPQPPSADADAPPSAPASSPNPAGRTPAPPPPSSPASDSDYVPPLTRKRRATASPAASPNPTTPSPPPAAAVPSSSAPTDRFSKSRAHGRSRIRQGQSVLPPSSQTLTGNLEFDIPSEQARYSASLNLPIIQCKSFVTTAVLDLGILSEVNTCIANIGWNTYFNVHHPALVELCREFYATYALNLPVNFDSDTPDVITFRLLGTRFAFSISEFNVAFQFVTEAATRSADYQTSLCDFPDAFVPLRFYRELTRNESLTFSPSTSKDIHIHSGALRYLHRFLAFNFSGRNNVPAIVSKTELFFLWCMQTGRKANLGFWLASQFHSVIATKRPLILGSYITHLAVNLGILNIDNHNMHVAHPTAPLDLRSLDNMGLLCRHNGAPCFGPAGAVVPREQRYFSAPPAAQPSTSASPAPPSSLAPLLARLDRMEEHLEELTSRTGQLEDQASRIDHNVAAICDALRIPDVQRP